ncbi:MAG: hypothetical protein GY755_13520 [Chloroflexi bacterium]|nr:hypothetical protein [Chloroflexota bacterium]
MKTFLVVLIVVVGDYLASVGIYNDWCLFPDVDPTETAKRAFTFLYLSSIFSFAAWVVLTGMFE